jgi:hypothetical protein
MSSFLDPLPADLASLQAKAAQSHSLNLSNVDEIISRLELARSHLINSTSQSGEQQLEPGQGKAGEGAVADTLLPLSSFVNTANGKSAQGFKEWGSAVSKLAKGVDKVRFLSLHSTSTGMVVRVVRGCRAACSKSCCR